jgi:hypothetical protein
MDKKGLACHKGVVKDQFPNGKGWNKGTFYISPKTNRNSTTTSTSHQHQPFSIGASIMVAIANRQFLPAPPTESVAPSPGRDFDAESGLYNCRARHYCAEVGTFISRDPIADVVDLYPHPDSSSA